MFLWALKFPRMSTNYRNSAKELKPTSLKYYHPWKIIIIMVRLFFIVSNILSCRRRVLRMATLKSSSPYHYYQHVGATCYARYVKTHLHSYFRRSSLWKRINQLWEHNICIVGWWRRTNQLALIINRSKIMITLKIQWRNTIWSLMKIIETNQDFRITLFLKQSLINPIRRRQPLTRRGERNSSRRKI